MAYQIKWDEKARKDFKSLDNSIKLNVDNYLKKLASVENPKVFGKQRMIFIP